MYIYVYICIYIYILRIDLQDRCAHDMHTDGFMRPCVACSSRRMSSLSRAPAGRSLATLENM